MKKTHAKFQKDGFKTGREVALTRGTVPTFYILRVKNYLVHNVEKVTKNELTKGPSGPDIDHLD